MAEFSEDIVARYATEQLALRVYRFSDGSGWVDDVVCEALIRLGPLAARALFHVQQAYSSASAEAARIEALN